MVMTIGQVEEAWKINTLGYVRSYARHGHVRATFNRIVAAARTRGWSVPWKARARFAIRGALGRLRPGKIS